MKLTDSIIEDICNMKNIFEYIGDDGKRLEIWTHPDGTIDIDSDNPDTSISINLSKEQIEKLKEVLNKL